MRLPESSQNSLQSTSSSDSQSTSSRTPSTACASSSKSSLAAPSSNGHSATNGSNGHASASNGVKRSIQKPGKSIARVNPPGTTMYGDPRVNREEFIRLVLHSLRDVGYHESAATLEIESGYTMESSQVGEFRQHILEGSWPIAEGLLRRMGLTEDEGLWDTRALIGQQKYLELLEAQRTTEALHVLRNELAPLRMHPSELQALSGLIMCTNAQELRLRTGWSGVGGDSRDRLLANLQKFIPSSIMIPPQRFATLLHQSQAYQRTRCAYHNVPATPETFSLYVDHQCDQADFPRTTTIILDGHTDEVYNLAWSHDGNYLASGSKDRTAMIWRIQGGECSLERVLRDHSDAVNCLAWSSDDLILLTSSDEVIRMWNVKTGMCTRVLNAHQETVSALAWLPDGSGFVSGGLDKNIFIWTTDGKQQECWGTATIRVTDLAVTPDYSRLVVVGSTSLLPEVVEEDSEIHRQPVENRMIVFDLQTKQAETSVLFSGDLTSLKISSDSRYAIVNQSSSEIQMWDLQSRRLTRKFAGHVQGRDIIRSCFGGVDENFIVSGSQDGAIYVWNRDAGSVLEELHGHGEGSVSAVAWNPHNEHMFASCSDDCSIRIWESTPTEETKRTSTPPSPVTGKGKTRQR